MNINDVARVLKNRRNAQYSSVVDGITRAKLGADGLRLALAHQWVETDLTFGLVVSNRRTKLNEIDSAALVTETPAAPCAVVDEARAMVLEHGNVMRQLTNPDKVPPVKIPVSVISGPDPSWAPFTLAAVAPVQEAEQYQPGDQVVIGEDGETYTATVQQARPDGKLVLSFGTKKPRTLKPAYDKTEVSRPQHGAAKPSAKPATPPAAEPASTATVAGGPAAPGVGH